MTWPGPTFLGPEQCVYPAGTLRRRLFEQLLDRSAPLRRGLRRQSQDLLLRVPSLLRAPESDDLQDLRVVLQALGRIDGRLSLFPGAGMKAQA